MIPEPVRIATPAGIGAFLAHLGLQSAEGIGIVVGDIATTVTLGGCPAERRTPMVAYDELCATQGICIFGDNYTCATLGGIMKSGTTWVGILGLLIIAIFMSYKSKLAFIYGIGFVTIISWFRNTAITYFPNDDIGNARFDYFKQVVAISPIDKIIVPYSGDLSAAGLALFTFLYVDFLESSGSFLGILNSMGVIDKDGEFPKSTQAFCVDGLCTVIGKGSDDCFPISLLLLPNHISHQICVRTIMHNNRFHLRIVASNMLHRKRGRS
jgi:AGZA family xanthine/uracil permease-like MFS transporter